MTKPTIFLDETSIQQTEGLPDGPHALLLIPKPLTCLLHTLQYESTLRCNGITTSKQTSHDVSFLSEDTPYLSVESDLGSCTFDARPFLSDCHIYYISNILHTNKETVSSKTSYADAIALCSAQAPIGVKTLQSSFTPIGTQPIVSEHSCISIRLHNNTHKGFRNFQALCRLLARMFEDCIQGHAIRCILTGVGNKVQCTAHTLTFIIGVSHRIGVQLPSTIWVRSETPTQFTLFGLQREEVAQWASMLRHHIFRKNAYALPVLHYEGEQVSVKKTRKK